MAVDVWPQFSHFFPLLLLVMLSHEPVPAVACNVVSRRLTCAPASPAGHPGKSKRGELSIFPQRLQVGGSGCLCVTPGILQDAGMLQRWPQAADPWWPQIQAGCACPPNHPSASPIRLTLSLPAGSGALPAHAPQHAFRAQGPGDSVPPALPGPHRQPRRAGGCCRAAAEAMATAAGAQHGAGRGPPRT